MNIGQSEVSALKRKDQSFVINSHQVHQRGVKIVDLHAVFNNVHAVVIGLAILHASIDSGAGQPDRETVAVVISTVALSSQVALRIHRATEFTAPDNQRVIQHASRFQIVEECGGRLVCVFGL